MDVSNLHEHFRDLTRWAIGDAVGEQLAPAQCDALAEELAVILTSSLTPALSREVEHQTEKTIASLQKGPVSFTGDHELLVDGFSVPDVVKLLDAVGRLMEDGLGASTSGLHETHQHMLYRAHDYWRGKNGQDFGDREDEDR